MSQHALVFVHMYAMHASLTQAFSFGYLRTTTNTTDFTSVWTSSICFHKQEQSWHRSSTHPHLCPTLWCTHMRTFIHTTSVLIPTSHSVSKHTVHVMHTNQPRIRSSAPVYVPSSNNQNLSPRYGSSPTNNNASPQYGHAHTHAHPQGHANDSPPYSASPGTKPFICTHVFLCAVTMSIRVL